MNLIGKLFGLTDTEAGTREVIKREVLEEFGQSLQRQSRHVNKKEGYLPVSEAIADTLLELGDQMVTGKPIVLGKITEVVQGKCKARRADFINKKPKPRTT